MIFVSLLLATALVSSTSAPDCPCVPPWKCKSRPYGSHALDIATFGLFPSCPVLGTVRCCPRDGVKEIQTSGNMVQQQTSRTTFHRNDLDAECECVSPGICLPHFVTASSQCQEFDELCCIPNSDINTAVQLFNTQVMQNDYLEDTHNPTDHGDGINIDDNFVISEPKPGYYGTGYNTENEAVPCVPGLKCAKLYGFHPLDIARFGTLPHCSRRGLVRCVELKAPTSRHPIFPSFLTPQGGHEAASRLPCVPINECSKIYGLDPLDIAKFGVLPLCASHGFARCIQRKHSTGSSSSISPTGSSPSTSSFGSSPGSSPSAAPAGTSPSLTSPTGSSPSAPPTGSSLNTSPTGSSPYQTGSYPSFSQSGSSSSSSQTVSSPSSSQTGSSSSSSQTGSSPSSSPSGIISNSKPQSSTAVDYQTPLNENSPDMQDFPSPIMPDFPSPDMQDFPSPDMLDFLSPNMQDFTPPDMQEYPYPDLDIHDYSSTEIQDSTSDIQNTEEHGNSNIDERASIVPLEPVTMHQVVEDDGDKEVKEFAPIVLNGNDRISEGVNLQVHLPTELIGTDIHKLLRNHLVGSNVLPGSIETEQKSDQYPRSRIDPDDNLDPSNSYKLENDQQIINDFDVVKTDNAQPSYFGEYQTDQFEPGINDLRKISKPDNVKHLSESVNRDDVLNDIVRTESDTIENETENIAHSESFNSDDDQVQSPESLISTDLSKDESKFIIRDRNQDYWFLSKISNPTNIFQSEDNNRPVNPDILETDEHHENTIETHVNNVTNMFSETVKNVTKPESIDEGANYVKPDNSEHPR